MTSSKSTPKDISFSSYLCPISTLVKNRRESYEIRLQNNRISSCFESGYKLIAPEKIKEIRDLDSSQKGRALEDLFLERNYLRFGINVDRGLYLDRTHEIPFCVARVYELRFFEEVVIPTYEREFGNLDTFRKKYNN